MWIDRIRREWGMERGFQTSLSLFSPKGVFILGDILDQVCYFGGGGGCGRVVMVVVIVVVEVEMAVD